MSQEELAMLGGKKVIDWEFKRYNSMRKKR